MTYLCSQLNTSHVVGAFTSYLVNERISVEIRCPELFSL